MKYVKFEDEDKIKFFDEIAECYYKNNFGILSKSEMELMMFRFYWEKMINDNTQEDGTIDYTKCSDYRISQELGITQQRVRNLKIKNQLANPVQIDWMKAFAKLTENARYDKTTQKIMINIPDPNLYLEIQNFIEDNGFYIEKQLNSKILQLRAEYYIDLVVAMEPDESREKIKKALKKMLKESGKEEKGFEDKAIGKMILEASVNITEVISNISSIISPQNIVGSAFLKLIKR